jgi:S1-C subfamily serine protease
MDNRKSHSTAITVVVAVVALLLGCCAGALGGAAAGYVIGQRAARQLPAVRLQRVTPPALVPAPRATPRTAQPTPRTPTTPESAPNPSVSGVIVQEVVAGSPAQTAGLKSGDVIVQLDNVRLDANHKLSDLVAGHQPGDQVKLTILRGGQNQVIAVTLGERVDNSGTAYLGVRYADATAAPQPTP